MPRPPSKRWAYPVIVIAGKVEPGQAEIVITMDVLTLSRLQFAATISFHYIYPPLSIGLGMMCGGIAQQYGFALALQQAGGYSLGSIISLRGNRSCHALSFGHRCGDLRQCCRPLRCRCSDVGLGHGPVTHLAVHAKDLPTLALRSADARGKQRLVFAQIAAHHQHALQLRQRGNGHAQPAHFVACLRKLGMAQARVDIV